MPIYHLKYKPTADLIDILAKVIYHWQQTCSLAWPSWVHSSQMHKTQGSGAKYQTDNM